MVPQSGTCIKAFAYRRTWNDGKLFCRLQNADLLTILDSKMDHFVHNAVKHFLPSLYIGMIKYQQNSTYEWEGLNKQAKYMGKGSITFGGRKQCITINIPPAKELFYWDSHACTLGAGCICEKSPVQLCPTGWFPNAAAGTCITMYRNNETWQNARELCKKQGADLPVFLNHDAERVFSDQKHIPAFWTGLNDRGSPGNFKWLDNSVDGLNYTNWKHPQPNGQPGANCVVLVSKGSAYWDDIDCGQKRYYFCEKLADCNVTKHGMTCPNNCTDPLCNRETKFCNPRNGICQNACSGQRYGKNCSRACNPGCGGVDSSCDIYSGQCRHGCQAGYEGVRCDTACSNNKYGLNCAENCSSRCVGTINICDVKTGFCLSGCKEGYSGVWCERECSSNTYGANCSKLCSPHCAGENKTCDFRDGRCLAGCESGFDGVRCERDRKGRITYSVWAIAASAIFSCLVSLICIMPILMSMLAKSKEKRASSLMENGEQVGEGELMELHFEEYEYYEVDNSSAFSHSAYSHIGSGVPHTKVKGKQKRRQDNKHLEHIGYDDQGSAVDSDAFSAVSAQHTAQQNEKRNRGVGYNRKNFFKGAGKKEQAPAMSDVGTEEGSHHASYKSN